jgi:hypothetical protein
MSKRGQLTIGIVGLFIAIIVIWALLLATTQNRRTNLQNFDKFLSNAPISEREEMSVMLNNIITANTSKGVSWGDAAIREDTFVSYYDDEHDIHYSQFVVDIESIRQSYFIEYQWSNSAQLPNGIIIRCPTLSQMIYETFECNTAYSSTDPILQYLEYEEYRFSVSYIDATENKTRLHSDIYLYVDDTEENKSEDAIERYKNKVVEWIESLGLNPSVYIIEYSVIRDSIPAR